MSKQRQVLAVLAVLVLVVGAVPVPTLAADDWADSEDDARTVSPDSDLTGTVGSGDDADSFKMRLSEGEHVSMSAVVPSAEEHFQIRVNTAQGTATLTNVSNAEHGDLDDGSTNLYDISSLSPAKWEIWAETDVVLEFSVFESGNDAEVPYEWNVSSTLHPATVTDSLPDDYEEATEFAATGEYSDTISTPDDVDTFKMQLSEGDHVSMSAVVPSAEEHFQIHVNTAQGEATIKNVSNAEHGDLGDGSTNLYDISSLSPAKWEIWAETDVILEFSVFEASSNNDVPYRWNLSSTLHPATVTDSLPDEYEEATEFAATGEYSGTISTPDDVDAFKMRLSEGDHVSMAAVLPSAEEHFQIHVNTAEGAATIKNVSNAEHGDLGDGSTNLYDISSLSAAKWEIWAETDVILEFSVFEASKDGEVPYGWNISSTLHSATVNDSWPDELSEAPQVAPTGTYSGTISTPGDVDTFKMTLREGDHTSMSVALPPAEEDFQFYVNTVEGKASIRNLSNVDSGTLGDGATNIYDISSVSPATWEVWAETDVILEFSMAEPNESATVPYGWGLQTRKNGALSGNNTAPRPDFAVSPSPPTVDEGVTFDASPSSDSDGVVESYAWDFDGDGQYDDASGKTATRTFQVAGEYTVGLQVTDDDGATDATTRTVTVAPGNQPPDASVTATPTRPVTGEQVTFDAAGSTDEDGAIGSYAWDLDGDGEYDDATGETATRTFETTGEHAVGLRVADDDGATDTTSATVLVTSPDGATNASISAVRDVPASAQPGETVPVTVEIAVEGSVSGLALDEDPGSVRVADQSTEPAGSYKESTHQWLWLTAENRTVTVNYTATIPDDASPGTTYSLDGTVSSSALPAVAVEGDANVTVRRCVASAVAGEDGRIDLREIQRAISAWAENDPVAGEVIDLRKIQTLINAWAQEQQVGCAGA